MRSDTFAFTIPPERIAQLPAERRDASRLMVVRRGSGVIEHCQFSDLPSLLRPHDLLLLNNTKVRPCRLYATRASGGRVEVFLLRTLSDCGFEALTNAGGKLDAGEVLSLPEATVTLLQRDAFGPGHWRVRLDSSKDVAEYLHTHGKMPLPQYIERAKGPDQRDALDRERYQSVFAEAEGAVAAPTASLHFTPAILDDCEARGIKRTFVTLHVGPGTFRPLKADTLAGHDMHAESYSVPPEATAAVSARRAAGGRVVCVGTTATRTLETVADERGVPRAGAGETRLFIHPPWRWRACDALLTNFHLPRSTLIFLVAAWLGVELTRQAYESALENDYRFFSYGDAMLCLPE